MHSEIVKAIKNNKLVFFIGSGFSQPLGYPNWKTLVGNIIKQLSKDYPELSPMQQLLNSGIMTEVEVLDKLVYHKKRVYEILNQEFSQIKGNSDLLGRHKKIGKITSMIVTTNYDKTLETSNSTFNKIVYSNKFHIENLNNTEKYIYKLHGCIEDPTSCILFKEDYENLYGTDSEHRGAIEELRKIIGDKTIIFLGFSLTDPYVNYQLQYINTIYKDLKGKHFLITTTTKKTTNLSGIEVLPIDNWDEGLDNLLEELYIIKNDQAITTAKDLIEQENQVKKFEVMKKTKIAILIASPINKNFNYDVNKILKPFSNTDITIDCYHLSLSTLHKLDGYDYILIFSVLFQNKVYIEDEYLLSNLITLKDLQTEILDEKFKCLFLFLDKNSSFKTEDLYLPMICTKFDEKTFNNFIFKIFRKGNSDIITTEVQLINETKITLPKLSLGKSIINFFKTNLPPEIDQKRLINFVGRTNDLENICRKILDLNSQLLTVKASGGVGKTTIIKRVVTELSKRGYFQDGIHFIDCEYISDFTTFEYRIGQCFDLDRTINLREHMIQNIRNIYKLIILDNFESLLYLNDTEPIKDLVAFLCDFSTVIITSREWINFEFEEQYELRSLTTDECVELFQKYYRYSIDTEEMKILRSSIIENLLNNNPLAIRIITSNIPKLKSMKLLQKDLEEDFFNTTKIGFDDIFVETVDNNIERSKSLYQSINYSYSKLSNKEKLVFEILSLFPDGIHMQNFVNLFKGDQYKKDIYKITDKEIKSLENKSLIQISHAFVQLQSIVGRFAAHKFNERNTQEKQNYYNKAYDYNSYTLSFLENEIYFEKQRLELFYNNIENFFYSLNYLDAVSIEKKFLLEYLITIAIHSNTINQSSKYIKRIESLKVFFEDVPKSSLLIDVLVCRLKYYEGDFQDSLDSLKIVLPINQCLELYASEDPIDVDIFVSAASIYKYGNEFDFLKAIIQSKQGKIYLDDLLFSLGFYKYIEEYIEFDEKSSFFKIEILYNLDKLDLESINKAIGALHKKDHLDIMQINYVKAKMGALSKEDIKKLVVVNPYSLGLKNLMYAFIEDDYSRCVKLYESAIKNLEHIKYYYVEAIYLFANYLKSNDTEEYTNWVIKGRDLAIKYQYRFLIHKFDCLINDYVQAYSEEKYNLNLEIGSLAEILNNKKVSKALVNYY